MYLNYYSTLKNQHDVFATKLNDLVPLRCELLCSDNRFNVNSKENNLKFDF